MKKFTVLTLVLAAMALLLAACGGGEEESGPVALSFEASDSFAFTPASATVSSGAEVEVTLTNTGALEHSWAVVASDADATLVTDSDAVNGSATGTVAGGETGSVTFTAPAAGTYQFVCTIAGHAAAGMVGTFTVN